MAKYSNKDAVVIVMAVFGLRKVVLGCLIVGGSSL